MIDLTGKAVLIVGLGDSGCEAAAAASGLGASVTAIDSSSEPSSLSMLPWLESKGVEVRLGVEVPDGLATYDLVVTSPGVPDRSPVLARAREEGLRVISELELAYRLLDNPIVAVTGTNGKTTTTTLIARMLDRPGRRAVACGNIGTPLVSLCSPLNKDACIRTSMHPHLLRSAPSRYSRSTARSRALHERRLGALDTTPYLWNGALRGEAGPDDILVVEASSFQLAYIEEFRARVSVVLNIAPDHFDWHRNMDEYRKAKMRLVENMLPGDYLVYNRDDDFCTQMALGARGVTVGFSVVSPPGEGLWIEGGWVVAGPPLEAGRILPVDEIGVSGIHNVGNVMAAAAASLVMGEPPARIREAAREFKGLAHRLEFVSRVGEVLFYNDSKATNPHAALQAIKSFDGPLVAIMGGRNKGLDLSELAGELCRGMESGAIRGVVFLGECADEFRAAVNRECGAAANNCMEMADDMEESVRKAYQLADGSGVVVLTPACASFDMFGDYQERGRVFKECVACLEGGDGVGDG
ncbi:MAG: UDP-N-acetylmuramoyl-L-alanine--D-glutamate ligase [Actinomycetia bacterium]|nr:UDP-N-acetylmuramoyl-L-alanine--D-glutamate ligase [Actinomycetes bacterium]